MDPFALRTARFTLDQPVAADVDVIAASCTDPVFERFMATPWPYERRHAVGFVDEYVTQGWSTGREWTWAIRTEPGADLLGVVGVRLEGGMVGYWLGAPYRGRGILPDVLDTVIDAVFARTDLDRVRWECTVGNVASMRVAAKCGFRYTGERPGLIPDRQGVPIPAWHGELARDESREEKPGWPADDGESQIAHSI